MGEGIHPALCMTKALRGRVEDDGGFSRRASRCFRLEVLRPPPGARYRRAAALFGVRCGGPTYTASAACSVPLPFLAAALARSAQLRTCACDHVHFVHRERCARCFATASLLCLASCRCFGRWLLLCVLLAARASPCALAGRVAAASVGSAASRVLSVAAARPLPPRRRLPAPAPPAPVAPVGALCGILSGGAGGSLWALLPPVAVVAAGAAPCRAARGAGGSALAARPLGLAALRAPPLRRSPVAAGGVASLLVLGRFALLLAMMGACCLPSPRCRSGPAPAQFLPAGLRQ